MPRRPRKLVELLSALSDDELVALRLEVGALLDDFIPAECWRGHSFGDVLYDIGGAKKVLARALSRVRGR
jgi:hypothetical protein